MKRHLRKGWSEIKGFEELRLPDVIVDAIQWTGENQHDVGEWMVRFSSSVIDFRSKPVVLVHNFRAPGEEDVLVVPPGYWILCGPAHNKLSMIPMALLEAAYAPDAEVAGP